MLWKQTTQAGQTVVHDPIFLDIKQVNRTKGLSLVQNKCIPVLAGHHSGHSTDRSWPRSNPLSLPLAQIKKASSLSNVAQHGAEGTLPPPNSSADNRRRRGVIPFTTRPHPHPSVNQDTDSAPRALQEGGDLLCASVSVSVRGEVGIVADYVNVAAYVQVCAFVNEKTTVDASLSITCLRLIGSASVHMLFLSFYYYYYYYYDNPQ